MNLQKCLAITLAAQMSLGMAAAPAIGVATARGVFRVNDAAVHGNGTLFSGARVETASAPGDLALIAGGKLTLGTNSSAQVFSDHLVLERGESRIAATSRGSFGVEANGLRIVSEGSGTSGRVSLGTNNKILVASTAGRLRVVTAAGVPLGAVNAGRALEFDTGGANSGAMQLTGCVSRQGGKVFITDEATSLTVELRQGLVDLQSVQKLVGKRVEIGGLHIPNSVPIALQVQAVGVAQAANRAGAGAGASAGASDGSAGACRGPAAGAAAGAAAGGAAAGGAAAGAAAGAGIGTAAVVTGVVVTGVAVGVGVGLTRDAKTPISLNN